MIPSTQRRKVCLYARVSTTNGQDPEVQLRELREFCQRRGLQIIEELVDRGISGSRERRPALDQLMAMCRKRSRAPPHAGRSCHKSRGDALWERGSHL